MSSSPATLRVEAVRKSFSGVVVLNDISFDVDPSEIVGLVGENGSGKSTTMNILAGVIQPDGGCMALDGECYAPTSRRNSEQRGIAFIQQELNIFPNLTVAQNLQIGALPTFSPHLPFLAMSRISERARALLKEVGLAVEPGMKAELLTPGERQLLEIGRALASDARVMIFDEPTTSLSRREIDRLFELIRRLASRGVAVIFISHALDDVLQLADRVLVLRDGTIKLRAARGGVTGQDLVRAMVGRPIDALFPKRATREAGKRTMLRVEGLGVPGIIEDVSFSIEPGEIMGLAGLMGAGRTETARMIFGLDHHRIGKVVCNGTELPSGDVAAAMAAGLAFVTEDRRHEGLMLDADVSENLALASLPLFARQWLGQIDSDRLREALIAMSKRLGVKCGDIERSPVGSLSGGNQQKVIIGRWLLRSPTLFILDEPTRGVDIGAKQEIYRELCALADQGMAILLISSELEELIGLCDNILVLQRGKLQARFARTEFDRETILQAAFGQMAAA